MAGTEGWQLVNLKSSDTVYTATQTKKLLANNSFQGSAEELPRYKKGKKKKTVNKKKKQEAYDAALDNLQYYKEIYNWTDAEYQAQYRNLYNQYAAWLTAEQQQAFYKAEEELATAQAKAEIERMQGVVEKSGAELESLVNYINTNAHLTADEKKDALKEAYKAALSYTKKEYEAGKKSWDDLLVAANNYWNQVGKNSKEYYESLEELRDSAVKSDENRLSYASKYVDYQIKMLEAQKEQEEETEKIAELEQDIVDAENELAKARNKKVRTFKDGKWIYDVDPDAIREAEEAVQDARKALQEEEKTAIELEIEKWEAIKDILDWTETESEMRDMGALVGAGFVETIKSLGTNVDLWKNVAQGLYDSIFALNWADGSALEQLLRNRTYATGTLSAPGGISLVGEKGAELAWLGKGDSVYSNRLSANLMQWGNYTPAQIISAASGNGGGQVFNFANLTLPNVTDANSFIKELQLLPNKAIQHSARR